MTVKDILDIGIAELCEKCQWGALGTETLIDYAIRQNGIVVASGFSKHISEELFHRKVTDWYVVADLQDVDTLIVWMDIAEEEQGR